jgi:hypothetical protein
MAHLTSRFGCGDYGHHSASQRDQQLAIPINLSSFPVFSGRFSQYNRALKIVISFAFCAI